MLQSLRKIHENEIRGRYCGRTWSSSCLEEAILRPWWRSRRFCRKSYIVVIATRSCMYVDSRQDVLEQEEFLGRTVVGGQEEWMDTACKSWSFSVGSMYLPRGRNESIGVLTSPPPTSTPSGKTRDPPRSCGTEVRAYQFFSPVSQQVPECNNHTASRCDLSVSRELIERIERVERLGNSLHAPQLLAGSCGIDCSIETTTSSPKRLCCVKFGVPDKLEDSIVIRLNDPSIGSRCRVRRFTHQIKTSSHHQLSYIQSSRHTFQQDVSLQQQQQQQQQQ